MFCVLIYHFSISITTTKKPTVPDIGGTTIQDVGSLAAMGLAMEAWRPHHEQWAYT